MTTVRLWGCFIFLNGNYKIERVGLGFPFLQTADSPESASCFLAACLHGSAEGSATEGLLGPKGPLACLLAAWPWVGAWGRGETPVL